MKTVPGAVLFDLGTIVMTPGVAVRVPDQRRAECLGQHVRGNPGCVCEEDKRTTQRAIVNGERILSAYAIDPELPCEGHGENCMWIITEADRSVTTLLLPEEY